MTSIMNEPIRIIATEKKIDDFHDIDHLRRCRQKMLLMIRLAAVVSSVTWVTVGHLVQHLCPGIFYSIGPRTGNAARYELQLVGA